MDLTAKKKIFIIAGEASGDKIGYLLMKQLRAASTSELEINGVGGEMMESIGLKTLFPMSEISLMGFFEIMPHFFKLKKLIDLTIKTIQEFNPDIVITIDSPGFCYRITKALKESIDTKFVHVVAPSVWAYKPERATKFAAVYDLLLTLLPIEPQYFLKEGLKSVFVGHFAFEQQLCFDKTIFKKKYNIEQNEKLICLTPGSRKSEVKRHMPIFAETIKLLQQKYKLKAVFLSASPEIKKMIYAYAVKTDIKDIIITCEDKFEAYKAADVALSKSGTNSLEISIHEAPQIVAYKLNWFSWKYIKFVALVKYASLVNILVNEEIIPEFLQDNCNSKLLAAGIAEFLENKEKGEEQIKRSKKILETLRHEDLNASAISAREILKLIS